uniref:Bromo domain-containing protein n=1 Tax=Gongylonema pulchrum TaxID=637853 RepID=A0A183DM93_9BILA
LEQIFENCCIFNEDNSAIRHAGDALRKFYVKRWKQLRYNFSKRLKRLRNPRLSSGGLVLSSSTLPAATSQQQAEQHQRATTSSPTHQSET